MAFETGFDPDEEAASAAVLRALAAVQGRSSRDVRPPLFESVDPRALDGLFERGRGTGTRVAFTHGGYGVEVRGDGRVVVREPDEVSSTVRGP